MDKLHPKIEPFLAHEGMRAGSGVEVLVADSEAAAVASRAIRAQRAPKRERGFRAISSSDFQKVPKGTPAEMYAEANALFKRCTEEDVDKALEIVSRLSLADHVPSITLIGKIHADKGSIPEAFDYLHRAAALGGIEAHFELALLCENASPNPDFDEAYDHYKKAHERGFSKATYPLALLVECGLGCRVDIDQALRLLLAAPQTPLVCTHLARLYLELGKGSCAERYFKKAVALGEEEVIHELGGLYETGEDDAIAKDLEKALQLYEIGIRMKDDWSMLKAGNLLVMDDFSKSNPPRGNRLIEQAYRAGNTLAGYIIAQEMYMSGDIKDAPQAIEMLKGFLADSESTDPEVVKAQFYLGAILLGELDGEVHDRAEGLRYLKLSVNAKYGDALNLIGKLFEEGDLLPKNASKAFLFFHDAALVGSVQGKENLSECFFLGIGTPRNIERGFHFLYDIRDENIADVNFGLGRCYRKGLGVQRNELLAYEYTYKAALQGIHSSYLYLGIDYLFGNGTEVNYAEAEKYLQMNNTSEAQFYLGMMALNGLGKSRDTSLAVELLTTASSDHVSAMMYLAKHYYSGKVLEVNYFKAFRLYQKAALADPKNALSRKMVGRMHAEGKGVRKNREQALAWLKLAEELGDQSAYRIIQGYERLWAQEDAMCQPKHRF